MSERGEPKACSSERKGTHNETRGNCASISFRPSRISSKPNWTGLLTWVSDCPKCPLLCFSADASQMGPEAGNDDAVHTSLATVQADCVNGVERQKMMHKARDLIDHHHVGEALSVLLELTKGVSYDLYEEEFTLLIHTAEIVVRNRLHSTRQMTMRDISHAIGFVKANIRRTSLCGPQLSQELANEEKTDFRDLLLTLVDIIQSLRYHLSADYVSIPSESTTNGDTVYELSEEEVEADPSSMSFLTENPLMKQRYNLYLTFFSLLVQSAFLEAGLVSGNVYVNRLICNAEEAYYLTLNCKDKHLAFMKPLGAYIYGRLWCETSEDESLGADFLSDFYDKHGADFEAMLQTASKDELHSTYLCNMRRIRQTVHKYQHLL